MENVVLQDPPVKVVVAKFVCEMAGDSGVDEEDDKKTDKEKEDNEDDG